MSVQAGRPAVRSFSFHLQSHTTCGDTFVRRSGLSQNTTLVPLLRPSATNIMAASGTGLDPPYLVETYGQDISAYQSISLHPTMQNMSFEELRLEHYNIGRDESTHKPADTSRLMATRQLSALSTDLPLRPIRAAADGFHKYVMTKGTHELHI